MNKIVIAPDSFKGTMSSMEVCNIIEESIKKVYPDIIVVKKPIADGGEGTVDAFLCAKGGKRIYVTVRDPFMRPTDAYYAILDDGKTAVIEMAQASGLPLVGKNKDAVKTTSFGTGELILDAIKNGCNKIILGVGGSATVDGGIGAAAALGVKFLDNKKNEIELNGGGLSQLFEIDTERVYEGVKHVELLIACDVENILCGKNGASYVYGPQKGANEEQVKQLDNNLLHYANSLKQKTGVDYSKIKGTGAAGGIGVSLMAFAGAKLMPGIDLIIETIDLKSTIHDADMIITGEGKMDGQSMQGKVPVGVARMAKKYGTPVIAVVGSIGNEIDQVYGEGIKAVFSTIKDSISFEAAKQTCREDLSALIISLMSFKKI